MPFFVSRGMRVVQLEGIEKAMKKPSGQTWVTALSVSSCIAVACVNGPVKSAEYLLRPGDALEFGVVGAPDLRTRAVVSTDGEVTFPLIGAMRADGVGISTLRERLKQAVQTKVLRNRMPDGREAPYVINPDDVTLAIAEYRPVYVTGDVAHSGEQGYRPGLTVRQAISAAGGVDLARGVARDALAPADIIGDKQITAAEIVRSRITIARIKAEMSDKPLVIPDVSQYGLPPETLANISRLESDQLSARREQLQSDINSGQRLLAQIDQQISLLSARQRKELEGANLELADAEKAKEFYDKGTMPFLRYSEERRNALLSSSRELLTSVELESTKKEREVKARELQKVVEDRKIANRTDLLEAEGKLRAQELHMAALTSKLMLVNSGRTRPEDVQVTLYRGSGDRTVATKSDQNAPVLPGDSIEVKVQTELLAGKAEDLTQ